MPDLKTVKRFCPICGSDVVMPEDTLAGMSEAPGLIAEAVLSAGEDAIGWSASEVAAHLADMEVVLGWRMRRIIVEDNPRLAVLDQEDWAEVLRYGDRDAKTSLQAFAAERALNVEILGRLSEDGWERTFRHPEFGPGTLRALVEHYADHDLAHLRQIRSE